MSRRRSVIIGDRSGKIVAKEIIKSPKSGKHCRVIIVCDCGNSKEMATQIFKKSKSCGCERSNSETWKRIGTKEKPRKLPDGEASKRGFIYYMKIGAVRRNINFLLTDDEIIFTAQSPCSYCGAAPSRQFKQNPSSNGVFVCNGIDRIDSSLGYVSNNITPCCKTCNMMKGVLSSKLFLEHAKRISDFQLNKEAAKE